jgi:hypothetical protein
MHVLANYRNFVDVDVVRILRAESLIAGAIVRRPESGRLTSSTNP